MERRGLRSETGFKSLPHTVGGRSSQTPLFRVRSKNHGSFGPASFAITRVFEVAAVRPLVRSRPSGSVCDWQRPRGITGSPWNAYWPRPEWVENQVCCGAHRVTHQRCSCYSTGSAWFHTQIVYEWNPRSLFCRNLIDSRTLSRPAGVFTTLFCH